MRHGFRLIYVISMYPTLTTTFIDREIEGLRARGFEIQIAAIRRPFQGSVLNQDQMDAIDSILYLLPAHAWLVLRAHLHFLVRRPLRFWATLATLLSGRHPSFRRRLKTLLHFSEGVSLAFLVRARCPDHIHAHFIDRTATVALVAARLLEYGYSVTAHANDIFVEPALIPTKVEGARFLVTVSNYNRQYVAERYPGLDTSRFHVLHPWVDTEKVQRRTPIPLSGDCFRILSVGRLVEKKGHRHLVAACALLRERGLRLECRIIGGGPLGADLQEEIRDLGLEEVVRLVGPQPQEQVRMELESCHVFCLPSVVAADGDREGIPVSLAEAMAMEVPVVSTALPGIEELVGPGSGILVAPGDVQGLAAALQAIALSDRERRRKMGETGRSLVMEGFDLEEGIDQLESLFLALPCGSRGVRDEG